MAKITLYNDPTLDALFNVIENEANNRPERKNKDGTRNIGASLIGNECNRRIWYHHKGYPQENISSYKGTLAADDGNRSEDVTADLLRKVPGITLLTNDPDNNNEQYHFKMYNGLFKGYIDGLITGLLQAPKKLHVWEHKAVKQEKFDRFNELRKEFGEKEVLAKWDFVFYTQAQIYMNRFNTDRHYITVSLPGVRDITSARTEYNKDFAEATLMKVERLLTARNPPVRSGSKPTNEVCKWCPFKKVCYEDA